MYIFRTEPYIAPRDTKLNEISSRLPHSLSSSFGKNNHRNRNKYKNIEIWQIKVPVLFHLICQSKEPGVPTQLMRGKRKPRTNVPINKDTIFYESIYSYIVMNLLSIVYREVYTTYTINLYKYTAFYVIFYQNIMEFQIKIDFCTTFSIVSFSFTFTI